MSLHKLTAGDGYTYLTRQVAVQDATSRGKDGLSDYYSQRGESPGQWLGRGADGLPEFPDDPQVTEDQMVALFGEGRHPDAVRIEAEMIAAGHDVPAVLAATRLGSPYKVSSEPGQWRTQLAVRFEAWNADAGLPRDWPIPPDERARIRTELAREMFSEQFGRAPLDARELSGYVAKASRQQTTAVAGYDLTFTPVKSVSALWAVASRADAQTIEACHDQVVSETIGWLEDNAAYSRLGRNGVRQVDVHGMIAAAFVHRDSRAGDPNLHTHVAVSNKVQTANGQWVALDGRPLHKLAVAASERYNTRLEALLTDRLGVRFAERPGADGKRPVREIVGVDAQLNTSWSARRASIDVRRAELSARFQRDHGRPPGPVEALKLAQQATLETRQAKHQPRTYAEQRATWRTEALGVLGGPERLEAMLSAVRQHPDRAAAVTADWVADTAEQVLVTVQSSRATWQEAHVRAEAERLARAADLGLDQVDQAVERVIAAALSPAQSLPLGAAEPVSEPAVLRRQDGSSMYASAAMQLYTSPQVVAAERSLIAAGHRRDGRRASTEAVELAILESAANGVQLNPGQTALVRELATSGGRLQLALAPAGTGKTTAMAVLARAWTGDGGTVLGLAPSAAAAAVLGAELLGAPTDTLAKLIWSLDHLADPAGSPAALVPDWVHQIGPDTLVVLDEAGMAGTPELARAVKFVVARGGSVRLIGDDQQLAAIGAGGVLRDLAETCGALTLSQVVRFHDPAEGAASLALRAGEPAAIGFYIDHRRVHVGDAGTVTEQAYTAWSADQAAGRDALMLAPTRQIAGELNSRARTDRLTAAGGQKGPQVQLADGSCASAGDTIITRRNNRRLAITSTDWVKNGDRFEVDAVSDNGALQVTHLATRRRLTLPADYTAEHVALGYASTVHAAQGSTAEVCHTVATGAETRQLLYVAMTRGRAGNHLYLTSAGDGDEHSVLTPDALLPPSAVDLLTRIVARDGAQTSATTAQRELTDPAGRLGAAADRFYDSLTVAAAHHLGPNRLTTLDQAAEHALPGLTAAPAWSSLRGHLALLAVDGHDPAAALTTAIEQGELGSASDPAAVLDWRLDPTGTHRTGTGPLPWLPAIPAGLAADPAWTGYLTGRETHTRDLAERVAERARGWTPTSAPAWAAPLLAADSDGSNTALIARLAVWRAATGVDNADLRPTGPPRLPAADVRAQKALNTAVRQALGRPSAAATRWRELAASIEPRLTTDPFWPQLADRLAAADRAGIDLPALARTVGQQGPLPDELPAAALWWRLSRHLSPATLDAHNSDTTGTASTLRPVWTPALTDLIGAATTRRVLADPAWPALVAVVTDATRNGWTAEQVLNTAYGLLGDLAARDTTDGSEEADRALRPGELTTALVWRIGMLTDAPFDSSSILPPDPAEQDSQPPEDLYVGVDPAVTLVPSSPDPPGPELLDADWLRGLEPPADPAGDPEPDDVPWLPQELDPAQTPGQTRLWQPAAASHDRLLELNRHAQEFFTGAYPGSWAAGHLLERLGTDLTEDPRFAPGYAPASWTALTDHLRGLGATADELLAAGLSSTARTGRLIDRFRDRLILPIRAADGQILAFIGRRNPDTPDAGPKYLNTGATELFSKGAQLYGMTEGAVELAAGATPVLVEGPLDAIAITLVGEGKAIGVSSLGTAFTDTQADQLRPYLGAGKPGVIVATDTDQAGHKAAVRAFWQLTARGGNPRHLVIPDGHDPASMLQTAGPDALREALTDPPTLARTLIDSRVAQYAERMHQVEGPVLAVRSAAEAIGALPPEYWLEHIDYLNSVVQTLPGEAHLAVLDAGHAWTQDPDGLTRKHLAERTIGPAPRSPSRSSDEPAVAGSAGPATPTQDAVPTLVDDAALVPGTLVEQWAADVWLDVGRNIDPRLVAGADWTGLAAALDRASRAGYDVQQHLPRLAAQSPLPELRPARALHYRLVEECAAAITPLPPAARQADDNTRTAAAAERMRIAAERLDNQHASRPAPGQPPVPRLTDPTRPVPAPVQNTERRGPQR
jgi:DNA primase catalytic core